MIKTVNLKKLYTTEEVETTALDNVNIEVDDGEFVAVTFTAKVRRRLSQKVGTVGHFFAASAWVVCHDIRPRSMRIVAGGAGHVAAFILNPEVVKKRESQFILLHICDG